MYAARRTKQTPRKKISCGGVSISSFSFPNESSIISEVQERQRMPE